MHAVTKVLFIVSLHSLYINSFTISILFYSQYTDTIMEFLVNNHYIDFLSCHPCTYNQYTNNITYSYNSILYDELKFT